MLQVSLIAKCNIVYIAFLIIWVGLAITMVEKLKVLRQEKKLPAEGTAET